MPANLDVVWSAPLSAVSTSVSAGTVLTKTVDGLSFVPATAANLVGSSVPAGVARGDGSAYQSVQIQQSGTIENELTGLGAGAKSPVIVDPTTARMVRKATPVSGDTQVGIANERGDVTLSLAGGLTSFTPAGDLGGSGVSQSVQGLQGRPVASTAPSTSQALVWNGSAWAPGTVASSFTAGADLIGNSSAQNVVGIRGYPVTATAPTTGQVLTFNGTSYAPAAATGIPNNAIANYSAVADGTTPTRAALVTASTAIGAGKQMYLPPGTYLIENDTTLACDLWFAPGAKFKVAAGKTLTLNGNISAHDYQDIFSPSIGLGVIVPTANAHVSWCWWGADSTGVADSIEAIQASIQAANAVVHAGVKSPPVSFGPAGAYYITRPIVMAGSRLSIEGAGTLSTNLTVNGRQHPCLVVTQNIGSLTRAAPLIGGGRGNSFNMNYVGVPPLGGAPSANYLLPGTETSQLQFGTLSTLTKLSVSFFYQIDSDPIEVKAGPHGLIDKAITGNGGVRTDQGDTAHVKTGWDISLTAAKKMHVQFNPSTGGYLVQDHPLTLTLGQLYYVELNWDSTASPPRANFHVAPVGGTYNATAHTITAAGPAGNILCDIYSLTYIGTAQNQFPDSGGGKECHGKISNFQIRNDYGLGATLSSIPSAYRSFDANTIYGTDFETAGPNGELVKGYSLGNTDASATYTVVRLGDAEVANDYGGGCSVRNLGMDCSLYCQLSVHMTTENVWVLGGTYGIWYNNNCYTSKIANCLVSVPSVFGVGVVNGGIITISDVESKSSGFSTICNGSGATWTSIYAQSPYVGMLVNSASSGATVNLESFYSTDEAFQKHDATLVIGGDASVVATNCVFENPGYHGNVYYGVYDPTVTYTQNSAVRPVATSPHTFRLKVAAASGVAPTDLTKWEDIVDDTIRMTSINARFLAVGCNWNDTGNVPVRINFALQGTVKDGAAIIIGGNKSGLQDINYSSPWHNSTNPKAVQGMWQGRSFGGFGTSGNANLINTSGVATIVGSGGGTNKTATVTFNTPEETPRYRVVTTCEPGVGTPAAGSLSGAYATAKTVNGFTVNVGTDPGASNSVDVNWLLTRHANSVPPAITSLTVTNGPPAGGTAVGIVGTGFVYNSEVWLNGVKMTSTYTSATRLDFTTPSVGSASGDYLIEVINPDDQHSNYIAYHYNGIPGIVSTSPTFLTTAGGTLAITGFSYLSGMTATYNGVNAAVSSITSTTANLAIPATSPQGSYNIVLTTTVGSSAPYAFSVSDPVGDGTAYTVAGAKHWIKSDLGVTVSGSSVVSIVDQSGASNNYNAGPTTQAPTLTSGAGGINGKPVFSFLKANAQYLKGPSLSTLTASHMFLILKPTVDGTAHSMLGGNAESSIEYYPYSTGAAFLGTGTTVRKPTGYSPSSAAQMLEIVSTATEYSVYVDGTLVYGPVANTVGFHSGGTFLGGCSDVNANTIPNNFGTGLIGEWLVFDHKLTSGNQTTVRTGLRARWGTP